jgi:DNA-binding PadR family transcriptional regulator
MPTEIDQHLPLTPLSMHILLALAEEDLHGYALMQAVRQQSGGAVSPGTGSLYAAVQRLVDDGLITVVTSDDRASGRRGSTYRLTDAGRQAASAEAKRMRGVLTLASDRKIIPEPERA